MVFTTQIFIAFPLTIFGVLVCRWLEQHFLIFKNCCLLDIALAGMSLVFYGCSGFGGIYRFFFYVLIVYAAGRLIYAANSRNLVLPLYQEKVSDILFGS